MTRSRDAEGYRAMRCGIGRAVAATCQWRRFRLFGGNPRSAAGSARCLRPIPGFDVAPPEGAQHQRSKGRLRAHGWWVLGRLRPRVPFGTMLRRAAGGCWYGPPSSTFEWRPVSRWGGGEKGCGSPNTCALLSYSYFISASTSASKRAEHTHARPTAHLRFVALVYDTQISKGHDIANARRALAEHQQNPSQDTECGHRL